MLRKAGGLKERGPFKAVWTAGDASRRLLITQVKLIRPALDKVFSSLHKSP